MTDSPLIQRLTELADPLARSMGLALWGIELAFGGRSLVRVFVESAAPAPLATEGGASEDGGETPEGAVQAQGVTVEQCAELSRLLGLSLDVEDLVPGAYVLEVSSPGLDRIFFTEEQLARAVGQAVDVTLAEPLEGFPGRRKFRGLLREAPSAGGGMFRLQLEEAAFPGEEPPLVDFTFAAVKKARQVHVPPEKVKPGKGGKKKAGAESGKAK